MIDLCKLFGVEEGEEFKIEGRGDDYEDVNYTIKDGQIYHRIPNDECWNVSYIEFNEIHGCEIIKLPKKKEFTDDELAIMRNVPIKFEWMARDKNKNELWLYQRKPIKDEYGNWGVNGEWYILGIYKHLFQSIQWEDEEPVFIDDYVERGAE